MPISHTPPLDWVALWRFGACWAGRPIAGLVLPKEVRSQVMLAVMELFMKVHPTAPGSIQSHIFVQQHAVRLALEAARQARLESGNPALWHDDTHRGTTPVIDLAVLQSDPASLLWQDVINHCKPRALGLQRAEGLVGADAEDIFAESLAALLQPRQSGTAILHDLLVYEQMPPLFLSIVRRRMINDLRHRRAAKRSEALTLSLHDEEAHTFTERRAFTTWASDEADPLSGVTLSRLAQECADQLSSLQQHILTVLYIEESATYMEVATAPWFRQAMAIKTGASEATCRRTLDRVHDDALSTLARSLGITSPSSS